jgi:adenylate kinase
MIIAVFGISGVGKSYMINGFIQSNSFAHAQASELLRKAKEELGSRVSAEDLRQGPVLDNQALLIDAFSKLRSVEARDMIFDGHTIIDAGNQLIEIPFHVIQAIGPAAIIHLWDEPETIVNRRASDSSRQRPARNAGELGAHQQRSEALAQDYADRLGLPFLRTRPGEHETFAAFISSVNIK